MLLFCLESQFDLVVVDRPMILQCVYQLHNSLSDRNILTWQFFLNRFEALFVEAQMQSNNTVDLTNLRGELGKFENSVYLYHAWSKGANDRPAQVVPAFAKFGPFCNLPPCMSTEIFIKIFQYFFIITLSPISKAICIQEET